MKSPKILDTRNILSRKELQNHGFSFDNVGRPLKWNLKKQNFMD